MAAATPDPACRLGLAVSANAAIEVSLDTPGLREALEDATLPKDVHDLKAVLRALAPHDVKLAGVRDDVMLLSYLVNPTHGSHTLPDIAARTTIRALMHQPTKINPADPNRLPEAAAAIVRLAAALATQIAEAGTVEHHIPKDDPALGGAMTTEMLFADPRHVHHRSAAAATIRRCSTSTTPSTCRSSPSSCAWSRPASASTLPSSRDMSSRLAVEMDTLAERIYADVRPARFNINSPKQLGDVLFNKMTCPSR